PDYTRKVDAEVARLQAAGKTELATKAAKVAEVSTFIWIADTASVSTISGYLEAAQKVEQETGKKQIVQMVVYNLPDRDCAAKASDGELKLSDGGEEKYEAYVKAVASEFAKFSGLSIAVALEPDSIGNLISNQNIAKCSNAAPAHKRLIGRAVALLQAPNVHLYLDGAHAAWLGWPANIAPAAKLYGEILEAAKNASSNATVRGIATNVSNYNGLGVRTAQSEDELAYVEALKPLLEEVGYPAHFIIAAGFGARPTSDTPNPIVDAIVWVKPGGDSDGTTNTTSPRYDTACSSNTSYIPSPEAGAWHSEMFALLIEQANPSF
ncbi:hypothetical protein FRC11_002964, partial [Ceratobasidium sp. 423]